MLQADRREARAQAARHQAELEQQVEALGRRERKLADERADMERRLAVAAAQRQQVGMGVPERVCMLGVRGGLVGARDQ